jgi:hypothetical protein
MDLYHRPDNPLFIPETIPFGPPVRFLFSAIGRGALGYSPFGLDYTRNHPAAPGEIDSFLEPTAQNYRLIGPMMRDMAKLSFAGKLQATEEEEKDAPPQTLHFGPWDAEVTYGAVRNRPAKGNPEPIGRVLVAQLSDHEFLVTGMYARVDFHTTLPGKHRQYLRVEQGAYEDGKFHFIRILNGDQTDWGLDFSADPSVLKVSVAVY